MGAKLLIVDDHDGFRAEAGELLRAELYEVIGEAEDVAAAQRLRPDVVLVDIQLPDFDGFEVARRILADPGAPTVILISSRTARSTAGASPRAAQRGSSSRRTSAGRQ